MSSCCIIIPCYNEEKRLPINHLGEFLNSNKDYHLCFVNDGSTDNTLQILNQLVSQFEENIFILNLPRNSGKAEAVRQGMLFCSQKRMFDYIAYLDADLSTPIDEINLLLKSIKNLENGILVIGSRVKRLGAKIDRKFSRHLYGRIFATLASNLLRMPVYDTQCGAKLFVSTIVSQVFNNPFISRWLFDVEILFRMKKIYGTDKLLQIIAEQPLHTWIEVGDSKISLLYFIKAPLELFKIYFKYR